MERVGVYGYLRSRDPRAGSRAGYVEGPLRHPGGTVRQQALVVICRGGCSEADPVGTGQESVASDEAL